MSLLDLEQVVRNAVDWQPCSRAPPATRTTSWGAKARLGSRRGTHETAFAPRAEQTHPEWRRETSLWGWGKTKRNEPQNEPCGGAWTPGSLSETDPTVSADFRMSRIHVSGVFAVYLRVSAHFARVFAVYSHTLRESCVPRVLTEYQCVFSHVFISRVPRLKMVNCNRVSKGQDTLYYKVSGVY